MANDRYSLWKLGISHVVNAAHGSSHCQGCRDFYGSSVDYYGVPADDSPTFDLSPHFFPSADYIKKALDGAGGKRAALAQIIFKIITCAPPEALCHSSVRSSSGLRPLCCRGEQVGRHRPGLPDDPPAPRPAGGHPQGQRAPLDLPKQGLPETAASSGRGAAGGPPEGAAAAAALISQLPVFKERLMKSELNSNLSAPLCLILTGGSCFFKPNCVESPQPEAETGFRTKCFQLYPTLWTPTFHFHLLIHAEPSINQHSQQEIQP